MYDNDLQFIIMSGIWLYLICLGFSCWCFLTIYNFLIIWNVIHIFTQFKYLTSLVVGFVMTENHTCNCHKQTVTLMILCQCFYSCIKKPVSNVVHNICKRSYSYKDNVYDVLFHPSHTWWSGLMVTATSFHADGRGSIPRRDTFFQSRKWTFYLQNYFITY